MSNVVNKLLDLINRDNGTTLTAAQVTVAAAAANVDGGILRDSTVRVNAVPGEGFKGFVDVWYNRIDLAVLFKNIDANVAYVAQPGDTTDALIPLINAKYGTDFEVGDFAVAPLVVSEDAQTVTMTAAAGNVAYIGSFDVVYAEFAQALDSVVLVTTLTGFNYPSADVAKGQAAVYSYNLDGTAQEAYWSSLVQAAAVDASIVTPFNQAWRVDEDWVFDDSGAPVAFNLGGATVHYTGTTAGAPAGLLINPLYSNVVLLQLDPVKCANFGGLMAVYFDVA